MYHLERPQTHQVRHLHWFKWEACTLDHRRVSTGCRFITSTQKST
ncbi:urate hydroxylase PuuD [Vibrio chagasii]|nr:urate hydroxylase PuuD [Vibrio chagasii]